MSTLGALSLIYVCYTYVATLIWMLFECRHGLPAATWKTTRRINESIVCCNVPDFFWNVKKSKNRSTFMMDFLMVWDIHGALSFLAISLFLYFSSILYTVKNKIMCRFCSGIGFVRLFTNYNQVDGKLFLEADLQNKFMGVTGVRVNHDRGGYLNNINSSTLTWSRSVLLLEYFMSTGWF